ncbi:hypothetical protein JTE90_013821 [Oedothorax gibbosus]|uniref:Uncharacterized protein n=1 Tax=Oedothorax gibbosus TaxID=931172 RepID=A0AAV6VKY6_9ARAC|nr:hypothetical protein JTE90_013821 [Oedothorax gibbosus]
MLLGICILFAQPTPSVCTAPGSPAANNYGRRQLQRNPLKPEAQTASRHFPTYSLSVHCQDLLQHKVMGCALPGSPAAQSYGHRQLQHNPLKPEAQGIDNSNATLRSQRPRLPVDISQPTPSVCTARISCSTKLWASTTPTQPAEARGPDCRSTLPNLPPKCALPGSPAAHNYWRRQLQHNPLKPEAQTAGRHCPTYSLSVHFQDLLQHIIMGCALPGSPAAQNYGRQQLQHNPLKPEAQTAGRHCPTYSLSVHFQDLLQHKLWSSTTPTQPAEARGPDCRSTLPNLPPQCALPQDLLQHIIMGRPRLPVDIAQPTPSVCTARISCSTNYGVDNVQHNPLKPEAQTAGRHCPTTPSVCTARISCSTNYGRHNSNNPLKPEAQTAGRHCPTYSLSVHFQDLLQHKLWSSTTPTQPAEARGPDCRSTLPNLPLSVHCQDLLQHKLWASTTPTQPAEARGPDCRSTLPNTTPSVCTARISCSTNYGRRQLQHNPLKPEAQTAGRHCPTYPSVCTARISCSTNYGRRQLQHNPLKPEAQTAGRHCPTTPSVCTARISCSTKLWASTTPTQPAEARGPDCRSTLPNLPLSCALPGSPAAQSYGRRQLQHNPLKPEAQTAGRHCPTTPSVCTARISCSTNYGRRQLQHNPLKPEAQTAGRHCPTYPQCALPGSPAAQSYGRRQLQHNPLKPEAQTAGRHCPTYPSVCTARISCSTNLWASTTPTQPAEARGPDCRSTLPNLLPQCALPGSPAAQNYGRRQLQHNPLKPEARLPVDIAQPTSSVCTSRISCSTNYGRRQLQHNPLKPEAQTAGRHCPTYSLSVHFQDLLQHKLWASTTPTQPLKPEAQTAGRHCPTYPSVCTARISCSTNYGRRQLQHNPLKPEAQTAARGPDCRSTLPNLPLSVHCQDLLQHKLWASTTPTQPAEARGPDCRSTLPNYPSVCTARISCSTNYGRRQLQHNPLKPEAQTAGRHCPTYSLSVHCQDLLQHKIMGVDNSNTTAEARGPDCRSTLPNLLPQCALPGSPAAQNYGRQTTPTQPAEARGPDCRSTLPNLPLSVHCQDLLQHKLWASTTPTQPAEARGPDCRSTLPNYSLSVHCQDLLQHKLWASTTPTQPAEARGPDCRSTLPNLLPQCALPGSPAAQIMVVDNANTTR